MSLRLQLKRTFRDAITAPPVIGAAYVLALAGWAGRRGSGDDADLGDMRRAEAVATFIAHRFAGIAAGIIDVQPTRIGYLARRALMLLRRPIRILVALRARRRAAIAVVAAFAVAEATAPSAATAQRRDAGAPRGAPSASGSGR